MKRRDFIRYSSAGLSLPFWMQSCNFSSTDYPVKVHSDHAIGHLIMESMNGKKKQGGQLDVAIVGGGIAGMTAAYKLRHQNIQLFELSERLGGTSGDESFQGIQFSQGAHYDLEYPENYGEGVIQLLEELRIIRYQPWTKSWGFVDQQHIIPYFRRQQCYDRGTFRRYVIPDSKLKDRFIELMMSYSDKVNLPTPIIEDKYRHLNKLSLLDFLNRHFEVTPALKRQLDYHMYDDYGGNAGQVSALAGVVYFACRPYYSRSVNLFSPPNGNAYFIQKMAEQIDRQKLNVNHLVTKIEKQDSNYKVNVLDVLQKEIVEYKAEQVIYAGQKHALRYIHPDQASLFNNSYVPWVVVNLITKQPPGDYGFWQNEYLGENPKFLGFIDSSVQHQKELKGYRVFTGYYCLKEEDRAYLTTIPEAKEELAKETHQYVQTALKQKIDVNACFIKVMGHAMAIPKPGYLFNDANRQKEAQMIYAGVDNGRLPLLFEALDSGITAVAYLG